MKRVFIDMDGVLVNFQSGIDRLDEKTKQEYDGHLDDVPGIFALMDPMQGAVEAVQQLKKQFDLYILVFRSNKKHKKSRPKDLLFLCYLVCLLKTDK